MAKKSIVQDRTSVNGREQSGRDNAVSMFKDTPIPDNEIAENFGVYIKRQDMMHIFFLQELYQRIINVNGVIMEFGVRWGLNMALMTNFRGIYEPFNYTRRIIGFDTFEGFPSVNAKDGDREFIQNGAYAVSEAYEVYLDKILSYHESESPIPHIQKYEIIKGDATKTFPKYLKERPETIVSLAYFDFDLYEPTKKCLKLIRGHLTKGSVIVFDQLNHPSFPGETLALKETFGLDQYRIQRSPLAPYVSFLVVE